MLLPPVAGVDTEAVPLCRSQPLRQCWQCCTECGSGSGAGSASSSSTLPATSPPEHLKVCLDDFMTGSRASGVSPPYLPHEGYTSGPACNHVP